MPADFLKKNVEQQPQRYASAVRLQYRSGGI
jgi:hypothetical protein